MANRFIISSVPTFLDGVYLGVAAIPDSCVVVNGPDGCYMKQEHIHVNHDLHSTLIHPLGLHRIIQTGITPQQLTFGAEDAVRDLLRSVVRRMKPRLVLVTETSMCLMTSDDLPKVAREMERELGVFIRYVQPQIFDGDFLDGFRAVLGTLVDVLLSSPGPRRALEPDSVAVVGLFSDRTEEDTRGNVGEIEDILGALDLRCTGILISGSPFDPLHRVLSAPVVAALPLGEEAARTLAGATGARVVPLPLPVGWSETAKCVLALGRETNRVRQAEAYIRAHLDRHRPTIEKARYYYLRDRLAAVVAEPSLAWGLTQFLRDIGFEVGLVALRTRHPDRGPWNNLPWPPEIKVVHDVNPMDLDESLRSDPLGRHYDLVIGSSQEREVAWVRGAGFIEVGYPSFVSHALFPKPFLGFHGAMRLLDECVHAVLRNDFERRLRGLDHA